MRVLFSRSVAVLCLLVLTLPLFAVTYLVPEDREMIQQSDDIVVATALRSHAELNARGGIVTIAELRIDQVLKGLHNNGDTLRLTAIGGRVADMVELVPGSPVYEDGKQYLIFTTTNGFGEPTTYQIALGQYEAKRDLNGLRYFEHPGEMTGFDAHTWEAYIDHPRDAGRFVAYIRGILNQSIDPAPDYILNAGQLSLPKPPENQTSASAFTITSYMLLSGGQGLRWPNPSCTIVNSGTMGGSPSIDGPAAVQQGRQAWNNDSNSNVLYSGGCTDNTATAGLTASDGKNAALFGDPNNELGGAAGLGGVSKAQGTHTFGGETFVTTKEIDLVLASGSTFPTQACLNSVTTHELGHTLGLRHADKDQNNPEGPCALPLDCASVAVMTAVTNCSYNGGLQTWDHTAISTIYAGSPTGSVCNAAAITTQPAGSTITSGSQATLSVSASGTGPLNFVWYIGNPPSVANPVPGGNTQSIQVSPTSTTTYWVLVSNNCCSVNSAAATVTVGACNAPQITSQPSGSTITSGNPATLSVTATGTGPLSYQWYTGNPPSTTTPVPGGTTASIQVSPTSTTTYWVRVTNNCPGTADSNAATVTVNSSCPTVTVGNPTSTDLGNGSFQLSVTASGGTGLTYQWFQGSIPGSGAQVGTGNPFTVSNISTSTSFWVRVTNSCNNTTDSRNVVTVGPQTCNNPVSILNQPQDQTVLAGATAQLSVGVLGTAPFSFQWFQGQPPDTSAPVGNTQTITTPVINTTTTFYVKVTNCGGTATSRVATVTATQICTPPAITTISANPQTAQPGTQITLSVTASGTGLTYQWFRGASGDTSNPITGATSASITDTPSATTSYWVKVSSGCGAAAANSNAVTVTITAACVPPSIVQPPDQQVIYGQKATITLQTTAGSGPLHYSWFMGPKFDTSHPIGTDSPTVTTPSALTQDTQFFVNVSNSCGNANSETITVKVELPRRRPTRR